MSNYCERCGGHRTVKVVDKTNAYAFVDIPCPVCAASGWSPDVPIAEGMHLCSRCGRKKYHYTYTGLRCVICEIDKIMEYNHNRAKGIK